MDFRGAVRGEGVAGMKVTWINQPGFTAQPAGWVRDRLFGIIPWGNKREWEVSLDVAHPLTARLEDWERRIFIRPDRHGFTDWGSIPRGLDILPGYGRTDYPASYYLHDSACRTHTLYFAPELDGPYLQSPVPSVFAARLLRLCVEAEDARPTAAAAIGACVRAFGPHWECEATNDYARTACEMVGVRQEQQSQGENPWQPHKTY